MASHCAILELGEMRVDRVTLPWVITGRGRNERNVIQYIVENHEQLPGYVEQAARLHWDTLMEVIRMQGIDIDTVGFDVRKFAEDIGIERLVRDIGVERLVDAIGVERVIDGIGIERLVRVAGAERVARALMKAIGKERFKQLMDKLEHEEQ